MDLLLGAAVLVVLAIAWVFVQVSDTRRELQLERLAGRLGLHFRFGLPAELRELLPRFRAIENAAARGRGFQAGINSVTGTRLGRKIAFFDVRWTVDLPVETNPLWWLTRRRTVNRMTRTVERSAVAIELGVGLQPLLIRPKNLVDKAMALAGVGDLEIAGLPEFSSAFYVSGPDPATALRLVTPTLARFFLENVRCTVEFAGPWMLLQDGSRLSPRRAEDLLDLAGRLSELVTREQSGSR